MIFFSIAYVMRIDSTYKNTETEGDSLKAYLCKVVCILRIYYIQDIFL